jgi:pimeloyl-ACP methyl ester carboxylesterase
LTFVDLSGKTIHYTRLGTESTSTPIVFLHEGLGSVELWRTFPQRVVEGTGHPGLVFSRHGHGWSQPLAAPRQSDFMHVEALQVLPELVGRLLDEPPILVGHSDGASIALIYAGSGHPVTAMVLIAPHVFVEVVTRISITAIRDRFPGSDMEERMSKYHNDPATTFHGWADIWLSPEFQGWNIEQYLPGVTCPILLVQGEADEYGTVSQLDAIERGVTGPSQRLLVSGAGHSPHISHADQVTDAIVGFVRAID